MAEVCALPSALLVVFVFGLQLGGVEVCSAGLTLIYLFVCMISQKVVDGFRRNLVDTLGV